MFGVSVKVDGDWRAQLLSAVQQVFVQERDVLKSILYSHLERLDTTDAVIHLNTLERALAEQVSIHVITHTPETSGAGHCTSLYK